MGRYYVYECDRCSAKNLSDESRTFIVTGRSTTPAGDTDDDGDHVDLCCKCVSRAFRFIINRRDYKLNAAVLEWLKKKSG